MEGGGESQELNSVALALTVVRFTVDMRVTCLFLGIHEKTGHIASLTCSTRNACFHYHIRNDSAFQGTGTTFLSAHH